MVKTWRI